MEDAAPSPPRRRFWNGRWQAWLVGLLVAAALVIAGALAWLDTSAGHRFLISRIAAVAPESGLRIRVERIDGSIYRKAVLRGLTLSDARGRFFDAPRVELDWWPLAWLSNRLDIDRLSIPTATLYSLPSLKPTGRKGPILPGFDIRLMQFSIGRLTIAQSVTGRRQVATVAGDADIRSGRAVIDMSAHVLGGEDALSLALDSRPDDDRFDLDVTVNAPAGGVLAAILGTRQDANMRVRGKGSWNRWDGQLAATLDAQPVMAFNLAARAGVYAVNGTIEGAAIAGGGLIQRLSAPRLRLRARGTMANRVIDGDLALRSPAIDLSADGAIDLRNNSFDNMLVDLKLSRPQALLKNMRGRDVAARVRLDGPLGAPGYEYLLGAKMLAFDRTMIHDLRADGKGRKAANGPALIPVRLRARRLDGQGDLVEGIIRNFTLDGVLQLENQHIVSNPMRVRSDKLSGDLVMIADLRTGRYDFGLTGRIDGLAIRGLGIVDLTSKLRAVPGPGGAFGLTGQAQARVRRLDNGFLRGLAGGLPTLTSRLALRPDGVLALDGMRLTAPELTLDADGYRRRDGSLHIEGGGRHARYGPVRLTLDGRIDRPKADVLLARPMDALGLRDVRLLLDPDAAGYAFTAEGGSTLGPFTGRGAVLLPPGNGQAVIRVARLDVAAVTASGDIRPVPGGLDGRLAVAGPVTGAITLSPVRDVQQVVLALEARNARFDGPSRIDLRQGKLDATLLLDPAGTSVNATMQARGLQIGGVRIGRLAANADMVDGRGKVRANVSGQRGRLFDLQAEAQVEPDRIRLSASGLIDRRPIRITRAAVLSRTDDGWRLSPATISFGGGSAQLAGRAGGEAVEIEARLDRLPLSLLDIAYDNLGLGGTASGSLSYSQPRGGVPAGRAELRLRGLSRSGLSLSSRPVDVGLNAQLTAERLAARLLFVADGQTIGRGQALLRPLGQGGFVTRIENAPLFAQLRYNGTADTLWRLTGVEIVDIAGPVALTADARGTIANPIISGNLATDGASIASPVTGMRLKGVKARGRFSGPQLTISDFTATAQNGGTVTGSGHFDFGGIKGVGMDLAFQANNAALLERDDIAATVTGPLTLKSNGAGGTIGGDVILDRSRFTLGRAAALAQIPELKVVEINRRGDEFERAPAAPWVLAIKARARNRLTVTGLGLDSEWRADLSIGGTVTNPAIGGTADLVRGGYEFAGRRFDLREGKIEFDGRTPVNPRLDIEAEANVNDINATIRVTGTGLAPIISFTSIPALPEDELLSRILFGTSITNLSAPEALQLASAVGSLQGGGGLDPINAVRKAAGLDRLRIIAADPAQGQGTSIAAGKYLTRKTYVELITDGQGYSATRIEYQVTRWLSLLGAISTLGRQSANVRVSKDY